MAASSMSALRVQTIERIEDLEPVVPAWERLDATVLPRTPFTSPLWSFLWWKHFRAVGALVKDEFAAHLVWDANDELVAVAPMMVTRRPAIGPLGVRHLQPLGADGNVTEVRRMTCAIERRHDASMALANHLLQRQDQWDWVDWCGVPEADLERAWPGGTSTRPYVTIPLYYLPLPRTWEDLKKGLSRNTKEALRKCYNSLERAGHTFKVRVVQDPAAVRGALAWFFELHTARALAPDTIAHSDVFGSPAARAFLEDYARGMAERGQLRVFQLEIAGRVVATRLGFVLGNELYLYYSGYDPAWGKFSVMTTLVAEAIKWAIDQQLSVVNLSTGRDRAKLRWGPQEMTFSRIVVPSPTLRGRLFSRVYGRVQRDSEKAAALGRLLAIARRSR
jgi:CelD/BcsL family acetyltransferase involved in cellulose biosynthesis